MPATSLTLAAALAAAAVSAVGTWFARGTTAVPAGLWAVAAWLVCAAEAGLRLAGGLTDPANAAAMRLVVTALAVCPTLALLGAKRPQHTVWQFIVATLAVVLALPAATAALARPGSMPAVHPIESWLILAIVIVGWLNFIGTRRGIAATLVTGGLLLAIRPFLPLVDPEQLVRGMLAAPAIDALAAVVAAAGTILAAVHTLAAGRRAAPGSGLAATVDPPFLAVRETLGAAWTLRIAERFDAIAAERGWPYRLTFAGLVTTADSRGAACDRDAQRAFTALLRRFVTADWLRRHMPKTGCSSNHPRPASVGSRGPRLMGDV